MTEKYRIKTPSKLKDAIQLARQIGEIVGNSKITLEEISADGNFLKILKNIPVADIPALVSVMIEPTPPDDDTAIDIYEELIRSSKDERD